MQMSQLDAALVDEVDLVITDDRQGCPVPGCAIAWSGGPRSAGVSGVQDVVVPPLPVADVSGIAAIQGDVVLHARAVRHKDRDYFPGAVGLLARVFEILRLAIT